MHNSKSLTLPTPSGRFQPQLEAIHNFLCMPQYERDITLGCQARTIEHRPFFLGKSSYWYVLPHLIVEKRYDLKTDEYTVRPITSLSPYLIPNYNVAHALIDETERLKDNSGNRTKALPTPSISTIKQTQF